MHRFLDDVIIETWQPPAYEDYVIGTDPFICILHAMLQYLFIIGGKVGNEEMKQ